MLTCRYRRNTDFAQYWHLVRASLRETRPFLVFKNAAMPMQPQHRVVISQRCTRELASTVPSAAMSATKGRRHLCGPGPRVGRIQVVEGGQVHPVAVPLVERPLSHRGPHVPQVRPLRLHALLEGAAQHLRGTQGSAAVGNDRVATKYRHI